MIRVEAVWLCTEPMDYKLILDRLGQGLKAALLKRRLSSQSH